MEKLNELRDKIHENAKQKGFYKEEELSKKWNVNNIRSIQHAFFAQKIALIHSELSEALEADRKGKKANLEGLDFALNDLGKKFTDAFEYCVKDTIEDELSDVIIRVLDLCGWLEIDIEKHVEYKMEYNKLREYKNGKEY